MRKLFFLFTIILLASCDCTYDYTYKVENNTDDTIKVCWRRYNSLDTTSIAAGQKEKLFITNHGVETCKEGPFFMDVKEDLTSIEIYKNDTLSKLNYQENAQWDYLNGEYNAVVKKAEFK